MPSYRVHESSCALPQVLDVNPMLGLAERNQGSGQPKLRVLMAARSALFGIILKDKEMN